ncbi:MAG: CPBP family intramembrane glutamic endopeptidase [Lentisphaeria bacterium]|jgi:hypothetical protein
MENERALARIAAVAPPPLPWPAARFQGWRRWRCAFGLVAAVPIFLLLATMVGRLLGRLAPGPAAQLCLALLPLHLGGLGVLLLFLAGGARRGGVTLARVLELETGGWPRHFRQALRTWIWIHPLSLLLTFLASLLAKQLFGRPPMEQPLFELLRGASAGAWLLAVGGIALLAPLAEEIIFRLALAEALGLLVQRAAPLAVAVVFSVAHGIPEQIPALFLLSLALQRLRRRGGSLWPAVFTHALFNGTSLALFWLALRLGFALE